MVFYSGSFEQRQDRSWPAVSGGMTDAVRLQKVWGQGSESHARVRNIENAQQP